MRKLLNVRLSLFLACIINQVVYQMIQHLIPIAQIAIRFENVPLSISVISVDGVVVVVESLRARVPAADVRLEAVLVLGQVGALRALDGEQFNGKYFSY